MQRRIGIAILSVVTTSSIVISGCATTSNGGFFHSAGSQFQSIFDSPNPCSNNNRNIGIVAGAAVGAALGYLIKDNAEAAVLGAAAGAGAGGLIGYALDQRRCRLYKIAQANHLKLASATITPEKLGIAQSGTHENKDQTMGLDVQLQNQKDEFVPGTAKLTPKAKKYFTQIAQQYSAGAGSASGNSKEKKAEQQLVGHKVLIVAHSDQGPNPEKAKALTEARARAVADVFREQGVAADNIYFQGAGDTLPIASNASPTGRLENQRVEIVDVPNKKVLKQFLRKRQPNAAYFKNVSSTAQATEPTVPAKPSSSKLHRSAPGGFDFGGQPLAKAKAEPIVLGKSVEHSMFSFISPAYAADRLSVGQCSNDQPHVAGAVRNLATDQELPIRDYLPGFYGAPWLGGFNGNLVVVDKALIPRDSGSPIPEPKLMIYKNYQGNSKAKPAYVARVPVNVYRGSKATLYRIFVDGPLQCIDLIKPTNPGNADARLYYLKNGVQYLADGAFALR